MVYVGTQWVRSIPIAARRCALLLVLSVAAASYAGSVHDSVTFDCRADNGRCPELLVVNDPPAQVPGFGPAPFRGYDDPSLRRDPRTGALWLSYSWVSTLIAPTSLPGKPVLDIGVGIHLARSDDDGRTFQYVKALWNIEPGVYEGTPGYSGHELSTLSPIASGWVAVVSAMLNEAHGRKFGAGLEIVFLADLDRRAVT